VLVGGVGQLYQGDLDAGRVLVERLAAIDLGPGVAVEDLHYGAVAVAQRLDELGVDALVLVGAETRGRAPGSVERRRVAAAGLGPQAAQAAQAAVSDAVTGYVGIDLVIEVAHALGALPSRTVVIDVEPATTEPRDALSGAVAAALDDMVELVRHEVRALKGATPP
jgi:hydrogenase maturation protease